MRNKKEILTNETIKEELKKISIYSIKSDIFLIVCFLLMASLFSLLVYKYNPNIFITVFFVIILILFLLRIIFGFWFLVKIFRAAVNDKFLITKEKLINKITPEKEISPIRDKTYFIKPWVFPADPYRLIFEHKTYCIPMGLNYLWSQKYTMDELGVFRSSNNGDEFYLIEIDNKIILAYNSEYFIYSLHE